MDTFMDWLMRIWINFNALPKKDYYKPRTPDKPLPRREPDAYIDEPHEPEPRTIPVPNIDNINTDEQKCFELTNAHRLSNGLSTLRWSKQLNRAAHKHSQRMAAANTMAHQLTGEDDAPTRVLKEGYDYVSMGENVAYGQRNGTEAFEAWRDSPPHNQNMLNPRFSEIGIALIENRVGVKYWTMVLGSRYR